MLVQDLLRELEGCHPGLEVFVRTKVEFECLDITVRAEGSGKVEDIEVSSRDGQVVLIVDNLEA